MIIQIRTHHQGQWWMNLQSYIGPPPDFQPSDSGCNLLGQAKVVKFVKMDLKQECQNHPFPKLLIIYDIEYHNHNTNHDVEL